MRLELALIVGILFFCSWCAYIVARMNSSVNVGTSAGAARASAPSSPSSSLSQFASSNGGTGGADLSRTVNGSVQPTLIGHEQQQQQSRLIGASEPIPSAQFTPPPPSGLYPAGRNWPPYVSGGDGGGVVDTTRGEGNYHGTNSGSQQMPHGAQQWQSYALPSHAHAAGSPAPAYASQPLLLDYTDQQQQPAMANVEDQDAAQGDPDEEEEEEAGPDDQGGVADYPQVAAASGEEPVEGEEEGEGEGDEEVEQPPPQTELEEVANRRSFDELQSDSSERDKDGRVVVTKRRHLINGRPVAANRPRHFFTQGQGEDQPDEEKEDVEHERTAASSRVPYSSATGSTRPGGGGRQSEVDFEKLVDEIDEEDKLRKRANAKAEVASQTAQSRQHDTRLRLSSGAPEPIGRRSDSDTPPSKQAPPAAAVGLPAVSRAVPARQQSERSNKQKPNEEDSHEHSLQESLQAQQWDDDSATSGNGGAANATDAAPEIGDEEDQEEVGNIVENDQEARKLARMSRDLLLSPERVSRELDEEQERRRRRRRRRRKRETIIRSSVPFSSFSSPPPTSSLPSLDNPLGNSVSSSVLRVPAASGATTQVQSGRKRDLSREGNIDTTMGREVHNATLAAAQTEQGLRAPPASSRADGRQTGRLAEEGPVASLWPLASASAPSGTIAAPAKVNGAREQVVFASNLSSSSSSFSPAVETIGHLKQNAGHLGANDQRDKPSNENGVQLSGLEDMHVEVLADPPAADNGGSQTGHIWPPSPATSYGLAYPAPAVATTAAPLGAPLSGHSHQSGPQLASGSHKVKKRKKKKKVTSVAKRKKKYNKSKMVDSKYKAARAYARKHASRHKKGQMRKKKRKSEKELVAQRKHFKGSTRGNKFARGEGAHGAKKGGNFYKDKGYKKRGFKKAYHKLETGDHKTYFDEFRDKDHHKKWKNFDDRHKYLQKKKWAGSDAKHLDAHKLKLAKARASKAGQWRESAANKHSNEMDKYKKYRKSSSKSKAIKSSGAKRKKKKKKKKVVKEKE